MTFAEYSKQLADLAPIKYPLAGRNIIYPSLKLAGEAGEVADKIGKNWRNKTHNFLKSYNLVSISRYEEEQVALMNMSADEISPELKIEIVKEMGDVLWYLWALCNELGITLEEVAKQNIIKIKGRIEAGTICGEGDNR